MTRVRAGQSIQIGKALAGVFAMGIFYGLFLAAWQPLSSELSGNGATNSTNEGMKMTTAMFDNFLLVFLLIAAMGVIAFAVFQRRGV